MSHGSRTGLKSRSKWRTLAALALGASFLLPAAAAGAPPGAIEKPPITSTSPSFGSGVRMVVDGDYMITGDPNRATAIIWHREADGTWKEEKVLSGSYGFGESVDISGKLAAVAAPYDHYGNPYVGVIYTYEKKDNNWVPLAPLAPSSHRAYSTAGYAGGDRASGIALEGNRLVIGIPNYYGSGYNAGAAMLWTWRGSYWDATAIHRLDQYSNGGVALSGSNLLARATDGYTYWMEAYRDSQYVGRIYSAFGSNPQFALHGDTLVIGEPQANSYRGQARVLEYGPSGWTQTLHLSAPSNVNYFGYSVAALNGEAFAVTSPGTSSRGEVHVYAKNVANGLKWEKVETVDADPNSVLSNGLAIDGKYLYARQVDLSTYRAKIRVLDFDSDKDGLAKWTEFKIGTKWNDPDTDDDFWGDGTEVHCGSLPLDPMSFPTPRCNGKLPEYVLDGSNANYAAVVGAYDATASTLAPVDADRDLVADPAESRVCGSAAAGTLASAGGAAGTCATSTDYRAPADAGATVRDPGAALAPAYASAPDFRTLPGSENVPTTFSVWQIPCAVEDRNDPTDGKCTGEGGRTQYAPPTL